MRLPVKDGRQYVSASLLRTYGAEMTLAGGEAPKGCPAKYRAQYHDKTLRRMTSPQLTFGLIVHEALRIMEDDAAGPEEALSRAWSEHAGEYLTPVDYQEALDDLRAYVARPSTPLDRYAVLATEQYLEALLYVDPEYGEIWYRCRVDAIALDHDQPALVHVGDWKTNRNPPSLDDVKGDIQLKGNAWCVYQCAEQLVPHIPQPRVVVHLDAIKHRELPAVYYTPADMEAWYEWTVALVKRILRDQDGRPRINEGCAYCPLRDTCPAYQQIPDLAVELAQVKPADRDDLADWRDRVAAAWSLLDKAKKDVDARFMADADREDGLVAGGWQWRREGNWINRIDARRFHRIVGDDTFYDAVTVTKRALETAAKSVDPETAVEIGRCLSRQVDGSKIVRRARGDD